MVAWGQKDGWESGASRGGGGAEDAGSDHEGPVGHGHDEWEVTGGFQQGKMSSETFLKGSVWQLCKELTVSHGEEAGDLLGGWGFQEKDKLWF